MDRMAVVFLLALLLAIVCSLFWPAAGAGKPDPDGGTSAFARLPGSTSALRASS